MKKTLICAGELDAYVHTDGILYLDDTMLMTPGAKDEAARRSIRIVHGCAEDERMLLGVAAYIKENYGITDIEQLYTMSKKIVATLHTAKNN